MPFPMLNTHLLVTILMLFFFLLLIASSEPFILVGISRLSVGYCFFTLGCPVNDANHSCCILLQVLCFLEHRVVWSGNMADMTHLERHWRQIYDSSLVEITDVSATALPPSWRACQNILMGSQVCVYIYIVYRWVCDRWPDLDCSVNSHIIILITIIIIIKTVISIYAFCIIVFSAYSE